ncbi:hypothetical protein LY78DRAFT_407741 [Colletotrichum sublineola]|nr:hypothetical protein LY78DRAFT_407741 [Colletotrichum sublineola]
MKVRAVSAPLLKWRSLKLATRSYSSFTTRSHSGDGELQDLSANQDASTLSCRSILYAAGIFGACIDSGFRRRLHIIGGMFALSCPITITRCKQSRVPFKRHPPHLPHSTPSRMQLQLTAIVRMDCESGRFQRLPPHKATPCASAGALFAHVL